MPNVSKYQSVSGGISIKILSVAVILIFHINFYRTAYLKVDQFDFLNNDEKRLLSQIQGRTYANMFGFVERFITAKVLETTRDHWLGDQTALEALIRFSDEELKHQALVSPDREDDGRWYGGGLQVFA